METRTKVIIASLSLVSSFALGRFTTPVKVITETKTIEVEKKEKTKDKEKHKRTEVIEVVKPDGSKETHTIITDDTESHSKSTDNKTVNTDTRTETTRNSSPVTISALGGMSADDLGKPIYGLSITKSILGPITVGAFGMTNRVVGISLGLTL